MQPGTHNDRASAPPGIEGVETRITRKAGSLLPSLTNQSRLSLLILGAAVVLGGWLRFSGLDAYEMTSDEGCTWAAAAAPTAKGVLHLALRLNPGKLGLQDLVLHFWMLACGDSVASMRALSAVLGTLAIVLVFAVVKELLMLDCEPGSPSHEECQAIAALSALVFALNVIAIRHSREARMYPLMLDATLGQVWFFARAARLGGAVNYAGAAFLAVAASAATLVAVPVFILEGFWLFYRLGRHGWWPVEPGSRHSWGLAIALTAAGAILALLIPWRERPPSYNSFFDWFRPMTVANLRWVFRPAVFSLLFPLTLGLAAWGTYRGGMRARDAVTLMRMWLWLPVLFLAIWLKEPAALLLVVGYAWTPIFVHRYVLTCLVPLSALMGVGIWELRLNWARTAALGLLVALALGRARAYRPSQDDLQWGAQWQEAAALAAPELRKGNPVNVELSTSVGVMRYYLRGEPGIDPALLSGDDPRATLVVVSDQARSIMGDAELHRGRDPRWAREVGSPPQPRVRPEAITPQPNRRTYHSRRVTGACPSACGFGVRALASSHGYSRGTTE